MASGDSKGDFELLSAYITIRTVGLEKVVAAFSKIKTLAADLQNVTVKIGGGPGGGMREAAAGAERFSRQLQSARLFMQQIQGSGRNVAQQLTALALLETRIRTLQTQRNLTTQQQLQLQTLLNSVMRRQATLQTQITAAATRAQAAANAAVNAGAARLNQLATALGNMQREVRQLMNSISLELGFAAPFLRLGTNVFRVSQSFRQLARVAGLSAGAIRLAGIAGGVLTVGLSAMNTALNIAGRLMATVARIAGNLLKQAFSVLLGPTLALVRAFRLLVQNLPLVAAGFAALATRSLVNIAQQFQRISSTFQFAFGPRAQQEMEFIRNLAERFGVPLLTIADNYGRIASAARDAGLSQRELQTLFEGTSAAAVALGLDAERVGGLFFAFEQVISKGRLSAEELRRQIGDRLPGAFNIAARAMGVTTQQLDELLRRGAIDSVQFMRLFGRELLNTFGGAAVTASSRLVATLQRMRDAFLQIGEAIAVKLEPGFVKLVNRVIDFTRGLARSAGFQRFVTFISQQLDVLDANFNRIVASILRTWERLQPSLERLGRVMFVLNTTAIGALIEGFTRLGEASGRVISFLERMTEELTGIDLSEVQISIEGVIGILSEIPAIFDIIELKIRAVIAASKVWYLEQSIFLRLIGDSAFSIARALATISGVGGTSAGSPAALELERLTAELQRQSDELQRRLGQIGASILEPKGFALTRESWTLIVDDAITAADEVSRVWSAVGDDITTAFSGAFEKVKQRAQDVFENIMAGFRRTTAAAGEGIRATTGSGATVSVLASRGTTAVDQTTTIARTTAENTTTLVALTEALNRSIQRLPFDFASVTGIGSVLVRPGGGLNK